jgi:ABC-type sulfate transport system substrate-binding protein
MKTLIFIALLFAVCYSEQNKIVYDSIVNVDSTSSGTLFVRVEQWFSETFKDAKNVIDVKDKEAGIISGKGSIFTNIWSTKADVVYFNIVVKVKDNKFRYTISNFVHVDLDKSSYPGEGGPLELNVPSCGKFKLTMKHWTQIKENVHSTMIKMCSDMVNSIKTSDENW